ncbi:hypothetical protein ACH5RR_012827 [Cinchona calisaya]|uniref:Uncharacterized protein n=1 Tax=Cinchona calisaya TaxID=153742 RepID=A0ABD3A8U4_9GENT
MNKKKQLEAPSERLRLIHNLPMVIEEPPSEGTMNDRQENECPPESIPTKEGEYTINCDKLSEGLRSSFPVNNVAADDKTTSDSRPVLKDVMANKKRNEASPNLISHKEYEGRETTSAQENVREQVNEARPLIPLTTNREPNVDLELLQLEIKKNKVMQEQESKGKRTATEQPVESINHTHTEQQSMRSIPPSLEGRNVIPANDRNPATVQQSNHECCPRRELDILKLSHFNSSRNITMLEDELKRLKAKMEEEAHESATKITRLEKKLDQMFEQSAKEAITSYKESQIAEDDVKKFLDPIYREAWTEALEEVKAKHLPDLDLSRFPRYDPKAGDKVDLVVKQICRAFIQVGHVMSQEATEKNCSVPNSEQHHLSPQGQEQQHPSPRATVEDGKFLEVPARIPQGANDECSEPNPEAWKKMHPLKKICLSSIQIDHGMSQEATEKKCSKPNAEQHLTTQAREVERSFLDGKVIEKIPAPDFKQATGDSSELKPEQKYPTVTTQAREVERTVEDDKVQGIPSPFPQE